jgi:hypothetical protein
MKERGEGKVVLWWLMVGRQRRPASNDLGTLVLPSPDRSIFFLPSSSHKTSVPALRKLARSPANFQSARKQCRHLNNFGISIFVFRSILFIFSILFFGNYLFFMM